MNIYEDQVYCESEFDKNFHIELKKTLFEERYLFLLPAVLTNLSINERPLTRSLPNTITQYKGKELQTIFCVGNVYNAARVHVLRIHYSKCYVYIKYAE